MKSCQHGRTETCCPDCAAFRLGIVRKPKAEKLVANRPLAEFEKNWREYFAEQGEHYVPLNSANVAEFLQAYTSRVIAEATAEENYELKQAIQVQAMQLEDNAREIASLKLRIEDSQNQKPVGIVKRWNEGGSGEFTSCEGLMLAQLPNDTKLYTALVIHPEVEELQAKLTKAEQNVKVLVETIYKTVEEKVREQCAMVMEKEPFFSNVAADAIRNAGSSEQTP